MRIITRAEIESVLPQIDLVQLIEAGFVAYSAGRSVVPPVGELLLDHGEVHIKYGYLKDDSYYVIKIASGFPNNLQLDLPPNNGLMLLFNQKTGQTEAILLDEGYLTDVRTAVAGAIVAKYMAPSKISRIGIIGTGVQARLQLQYLSLVTDCRQVSVFGRNRDRLGLYQADMTAAGYEVEVFDNPADVAASSNLIVTTTAARDPLLLMEDIRPGTHITAMGSDTPHKQEVDSMILNKAHKIVADSVSQCLVRGEISKAIEANLLSQDRLLELGDVITGQLSGRDDDSQITIADLTGVAVQDIQIAKGVVDALGS